MMYLLLGMAQHSGNVHEANAEYRNSVAERELSSGRRLARHEAQRLEPDGAKPLKGGLTVVRWSPQRLLGRTPTRDESAELSRALRRLEERGFLERIDPQRGAKIRTQRVRMTKAGARAAAELILTGKLTA